MTATGYRVTFGRVVRSEWTKLFSLRSSWLLLGGLPVLLPILAAIIGSNSRGRPTPPSISASVGGGFLLFVLAIGVFGLLAITREYQSGLIRSTMLAVPGRLPVLWAKAVVLVLATAPTMLVAQFGSFLAYQATTSTAARMSLGDPGVVQALLGATGATVAAGLMGLAIGALVRSTAGAIVTFVAGLVVVPQILLGALPAALQDTVLPYLPTLALQSLFDLDGATPVLAPGAGAIVVVAWIALLLGAGALLLRSRDA